MHGPEEEEGAAEGSKAPSAQSKKSKQPSAEGDKPAENAEAAAE